MARWIDVYDLGVPHDTGAIDTNGRAVWAVNVMLYKEPSATTTREVVRVLQDAGVGTFGTDLWESSKAPIPKGDGPFMNVSATGGPSGIRTHNVTSGPTYERPTVMVTVYCSSAQTAEAKARAAYAALLAVKNQTITPV